MKASRWVRFFELLLIVALVFLVATLIMPAIKTPQELLATGPVRPYGNFNYTISGYYIPPVNEGDVVRVSIANFTPSSVEISVFPTQESTIAPAGPPIFEGSPVGRNYTNVFLSTQTQPYGIFVTSYNRTAYLLSVESSWSPFYNLREYFAPAIFLVFGAAVALYYYILTARKEALFEKAIQEARESPTAGGRTIRS